MNSLFGGQRRGAVEIKVEFKNIYPRLTEETELATFGMAGDKLANCRLREVALACDSCGLKVGTSRGDVRVEPGAGSGDKVDRDVGVRTIALKRGDVACDAVNELLVGRRVV